MPDVVSFHANLRAGCTRCVPGRPAEVDRPHGMDAWIINCTVAGRGRINRGDTAFTVEPYDLLLFPPEVPHDYGPQLPQGRWTHLWAYFQPRAAWRPLLSWPERAGGVRHLRLDHPAWRQEVRSQLERVIAYATGGERRRDEWAMNALEAALLRLDSINPAAGDSVDLRVRRAMAFLGEHHRRAIRLDEVAAACALSVSRLAHLFQAQTGQSPMRWLEEHRIARARDWLQFGEAAIAAVGAEVGIPDPVYFARVFRRRSGCTPRVFRERCRQP